MTSIYRFAGPALLAVVAPVALSAACSSGTGSSGNGAGVLPPGDTSTAATSTATTPTATSGATTSSPVSSPSGTSTSGTTSQTPDASTTGTSTPDAGNGAGTGTGDAAPVMTSTPPVMPVPAQDSGAATTLAAWGTPTAGGPTGTGLAATVTVDTATTVGNIGADFIGFSYEKTHITNDSLNSTNTNLVGLYKLLGSPVMRLGADDVDNCNWGGTGTAPTAASGPPFSKSITTGMVDDICAFLGATGTKILYGVNFHSDNVTASAAEAAYVMSKCPASIIGFEIGNEINRYGSWASLQTEWESFATAIVATPGANLIGPVAGGGDALSLSTPFAADESVKFGSKLVLLTQHYYAGTANTTTATTIRLQTPDPDPATSQAGLVGTSSAMDKAATTNKIPDAWRMGEVNTFSGHGQQGISDALIAGLWSLDLMFVVAENGGSGVNFHGGEEGMDGSRNFYYEPIEELDGVVQQVHPVYYGMLMFVLAGTGPMVSTTVTTTNPYFTSYAIKANGFVSVVLDNKNATSGVNATVNLGSAVTSASAIYLEGTPAGDLTAAAGDVTVGGSLVSNAGAWTSTGTYTQTTSGSSVTVYIPPAAAALVRVMQ